MPFTAAHPAIVLPFLRVHPKYISASALVIGSMAPDFEYFLKLSVRSTHSHTIAGLFYFDLPLTIALAFVFHTVVKQNLIQNLPAPLQQKYHALESFDFVNYFKSHYIAFSVCAVFGSATHILWDSFTHSSGYFAQHFSIIKDSRVFIFGKHQPMFHVLQHGSTAVGFLAIVLYVFFLRRQPTEAKRPQILYWLLLVVIACVVVALRFQVRSDDLRIGNVVVTSISGVCIGLIVLGFKKYK